MFKFNVNVRVGLFRFVLIKLRHCLHLALPKDPFRHVRPRRSSVHRGLLYVGLDTHTLFRRPCLSLAVGFERFLPRDAMHSADSMQSQDVCPSVTRRYSVKLLDIIILILSASSGSLTTLVFVYQTVWQYSDFVPPNGASNEREYEKIAIFDQYLTLFRKYNTTQSNS